MNIKFKNGRIILQWILRKQDLRMYIGFTCLRTRTSSGLLWRQ